MQDTRPTTRPNIPVPDDPQYSITVFKSSTGFRSEIPGELGFRQPRSVAEALTSMAELLDNIDKTLESQKGNA